MRINGGIFYNENGLTTSIRAMHLDSELIGISNENIGGFDKVGYQRKEAVVSSFAEFLGVHALSTTKDDKVGRIAVSDNPLDIALANKGYFQTESKNGIKLTRDGRFKIGKDGSLLTLEDAHVLSSAGTPIQLPFVPQDLKQIKIDKSGKISLFNPDTNKLMNVGQIGVVDTNGILVMDPNVKQGYNEFSNVSLQQEFITMMPIMKNFDANRQMFMLQNANLGKAISQLSSAS
ncbi:MAG: flagellar basal body rod C-terminal domain-containing protein [Candidatus Gastranaerophilaceae bacterium]|jgi:flagellar basal-body rod protein FlgF|nr:flagellar basal body rod C-terminal domain-containing protein [Cyanobacteriota bacterium]